MPGWKSRERESNKNQNRHSSGAMQKVLTKGGKKKQFRLKTTTFSSKDENANDTRNCIREGHQPAL